MTTPELTAAYKTVLTAMGYAKYAPHLWTHPNNGIGQALDDRSNIDANFVFGTVVPWAEGKGIDLFPSRYKGSWRCAFESPESANEVYANTVEDAIMLAAAAALEAQRADNG